MVPLLLPSPLLFLPNSLPASTTKQDLQRRQLAQCRVKQPGRRIQLEKNDITCAMGEEGQGWGWREPGGGEEHEERVWEGLKGRRLKKEIWGGAGGNKSVIGCRADVDKRGKG